MTVSEECKVSAISRQKCYCLNQSSTPIASFLAAGGQLLARSGQHRVRLLAYQQSQRLQHDQLWRWVCCGPVWVGFLRSSWLSADGLAGPGAVAGLEMAWVQRPPDKVTNGEEFNVSYTVTASDSFYDYAVRNRIFQFGWVCYVNTWNLQRLPCPERKYACVSEASSSNGTSVARMAIL